MKATNNTNTMNSLVLNISMVIAFLVVLMLNCVICFTTIDSLVCATIAFLAICIVTGIIIIFGFKELQRKN
jgi:hypothetical protein